MAPIGRCPQGPGTALGYGWRVPLVAAAVCPHPPVIVPQIAAGAAAELDGLRAACAEAVARLRATDADVLVVVGGAAQTRRIAAPFRVSFAPWGVALTMGSQGEPLPLSLAIAVWLLEGGPLAQPGVQTRAQGAPLPPVSPVLDAPALDALVLQTVASSASTAECRALGERLGAAADRVALLVMGDGSAERRETPQGYEDPRALPYDRLVAEALAAGDARALLALDPALSADLGAAGRAAWQVLAGAALASGGAWQGDLLYDDAPYGVAYFVASWRPA